MTDPKGIVWPHISPTMWKEMNNYNAMATKTRADYYEQYLTQSKKTRPSNSVGLISHQLSRMRHPNALSDMLKVLLQFTNGLEEFYWRYEDPNSEEGLCRMASVRREEDTRPGWIYMSMHLRGARGFDCVTHCPQLNRGIPPLVRRDMEALNKVLGFPDEFVVDINLKETPHPKGAWTDNFAPAYTLDRIELRSGEYIIRIDCDGIPENTSPDIRMARRAGLTVYSIQKRHTEGLERLKIISSPADGYISWRSTRSGTLSDLMMGDEWTEDELAAASMFGFDNEIWVDKAKEKLNMDIPEYTKEDIIRCNRPFLI